MHRLGLPVTSVKVSYDRGESIPILVASDWHIGSKHCDMSLIKRIMTYAEEVDAYIILNGDILEMAIRNSVGSPYECDMTPNEQIEEMCSIFDKRHKILAVLEGNHEARTKKHADVDIVSLFASMQPMIPYLDRAGAIALNTSKGATYIIYAQHGVRGGGRKPGGAMNAIHDMMENVDADIYIHGHHHRLSLTKQMQLQFKPGNIGWCWKPKWFVNAGTMHKYGGYASDAAFAPTDTGCYMLWLKDGSKKNGKGVVAETLDREFFGMSR
jgi:UDP-2,3-diacylglucosamine pyrophosphatase LpxH